MTEFTHNDMVEYLRSRLRVNDIARGHILECSTLVSDAYGKRGDIQLTTGILMASFHDFLITGTGRCIDCQPGFSATIVQLASAYAAEVMDCVKE